jgi:G3E family GTPase
MAKNSHLTERLDGRIKMTILGGYLGSGKTTWLRHQLHEGHFSNALVIVNEAAETPVDDALLQQSSQIRVLPGGCCCCTGLEALLALLRNVCDERSRITSTEARLARIVLETSGLADPAPIVDAIRKDKILVNHIVVSDVIVAVDALHALSQLNSEPLGRNQVEAADCFVVTKLDEAEERDVARLLATLHSLNPGASIKGTIQGSEVLLPSYEGIEPHVLAELSAGSAKPPPFPTKVHLGGGIDWTVFSVWLSALLHARGDDVVRVKGVVRTPAGRLLVQTVRKIVQSPEILPDQGEDPAREDNAIVIIGRGYEPADLVSSLKSFARGISSPSPP